MCTFPGTLKTPIETLWYITSVGMISGLVKHFDKKDAQVCYSEGRPAVRMEWVAGCYEYSDGGLVAGSASPETNDQDGCSLQHIVPSVRLTQLCACTIY